MINFRWFVKIFFFFMFLLLMGSVITLWREMSGNPVDPVEGDVLIRNLLLFGYVLCSLLLFLYIRTTVQAILHTPLLWSFIGWVLLTVLWSNSPDITVRRALAMLLTVVFSIAVYVSLSFDEFLQLFGIALFVSLSLSLFFIIVWPEWGIMGNPHQGAWRGVFVHKNLLGRFASVGILVFATLLSRKNNFSKPVWFWWVAIFLALLLLVGSRSITSLVLTIVSIIAGLFLITGAHSRKAFFNYLAIFSMVTLIISIILALNFSWFVELFGKDITLTGRVPLWQTLLPIGLREFVQGYGYGAFWLGWEGPSAEVWTFITWNPPHAHNGFIDLWLETGFIGLLLGLTMLFMFLWRGFRFGVTKKKYFWALIGIFFFVYNLVESAFARQNNLFWFLFVLGYLNLSAGSKEIRSGRKYLGEDKN